MKKIEIAFVLLLFISSANAVSYTFDAVPSEGIEIINLNPACAIPVTINQNPADLASDAAGECPKWKIENGYLSEATNSADSFALISKNFSGNNFTISADLKSPGSLNNKLGIVFNYIDNGNYYEFEWLDPTNFYGGTAGEIQPEWNLTNYFLSKKSGGTKTILAWGGTAWNAENPAAISSGNFENIQIKGNQSNIQVFRNNSLIMESAEPATLNGKTGFSTWNNDTGVFYDNLTINYARSTTSAPDLGFSEALIGIAASIFLLHLSIKSKK